MIHERLKEIYDEFDRYCRGNNIDYSIDADYYNLQGYRLLNGSHVVDVLRHMANYVKDKWVDLEYNGFPVDYNDLKASNFNVSTYNPLFKFTLKSIQEDEMISEDSIKGPSNSHARRQAAFPSSFRRNKTRDTYNGDAPKKKKKKKKKKTKSESLDQSQSFEERLFDSINENVGLSIVEPDILMTVDSVNSEDETNEEDFEETLKSESRSLQKFISILEKTNDERKAAIIESLIDNCTTRINLLNEIVSKDNESN